MPGSGRSSYCTLPMFHAPRNPNVAVDGHGYISADGHLFECNSPTIVQQSFHVYAYLCLAAEDADISTSVGYSSSTGQVM